MKIISIEEHFRPKCFHEFLLSRTEAPRLELIEDKDKNKVYREWYSEHTYIIQNDEVYAKNCDIGEKRLRVMDALGIDMQVLSSPGNEFLRYEPSVTRDLVEKTNEEIYQAITTYPDRFLGFTSLALNNPDEAANELERTVTQLGFKGTMITPTVLDEYIDAPKFMPLFERAAILDVPIYLHPGPSHPKSRHQFDGYPELAGAMWGFGMETGLSAMRLICSGIFDEYPDLKIILGHMGEALPYWMARMDNRLLVLTEKKQTPYRANGDLLYTPLTATLKKLPSQYIKDNFYITTSGVMWAPALLCSLLALGAEKILFAVDYPFEDEKESIQSIKEGPISESDKEKIFHLNAERLFKI